LKENDQGIRVLANELVASQVAAKLGVPTPEGVIVELDQAFLDANPVLGTRYARPVTQGAHFGSMVVRNTFDNPPAALINTVSNKGDFPQIVVFDVLTENSDRANATNFLIVRPDHYPQQTHFVSVDHGHCFGYNWDLNLPHRVGTWCRSHLREITDAISGPDPFGQAIAEARRVSPQWLGGLLSELPEEWGVSPEELNALRDFLLGQARRLEEILSRERALFPNWRERSGQDHARIPLLLRRGKVRPQSFAR
jgi:hypothetical protein